MAPSTPVPPLGAPDFDSPEYDAQKERAQGHAPAEQQMEQVVRGALDEVMRRFSLAVQEHRAHTRAVTDAVDSCLASCLEAIEMQYPAREDNPVSAISLEHGSWEQEQAPDPCTLDSWLRSALPETVPAATSGSGRDSWVMQQFLSKQPSMHRSASMRSNGSTTGADADSPLPPGLSGLSPDAARRARTSSAHSASGARGGHITGASARSMLHGATSRRVVKKLDTRKHMTPEQEVQEEQLRQELQQRKAQEERSRRLEARDAEERSKLASLRKELKGKDYTYDHKGEVVILNEFDPDRTPLEALSGPAYKVAVPEDAGRTLSPKRRNTLRSASSKSVAAAAAAAEAAAAARGPSQLSPTEMRRERDRRLASDFKKVAPKTQPSALDTLMPAGGVVLRGAGGATKTGPLRPAQQGITRDQYHKQVAKKQFQAQVSEGVVPGTPLSPAMRAHSMFREPLGSLRGTAGGVRSVTLGSMTAAAAAAAGGPVAALAAARAALIAERQGDPLAAYEDDKYDPFSGARVRPRAASIAPAAALATKPSTPDVNLSLTEAGDWGSAGMGRAYEAPPSLPHSKPTEKQMVETVGRGERLPRDRAPLPTLSPPLAPGKTGVAKETGRLHFHSVLAE